MWTLNQWNKCLWFIGSALSTAVDIAICKNNNLFNIKISCCQNPARLLSFMMPSTIKRPGKNIFIFYKSECQLKDEVCVFSWSHIWTKRSSATHSTRWAKGSCLWRSSRINTQGQYACASRIFILLIFELFYINFFSIWLTGDFCSFARIDFYIDQ